MLKETLAAVITTKPEVIQFTKDRKSEAAWIISSKAPRPTEVECQAYLEKDPFELLIVEYIWNASDDNNRFVLTLFLDKNCQLRDQKLFIKINLDLFAGYSDFSSFLNSLDTQVIGKEYLFTTPVEAVNMGIFNHWFSVGPVDLWNSGDTLNAEDIGNKINQRRDILESQLNCQSLFFRFNVSGKEAGPYYGLKTHCCNKLGDKWVVDFAKTNYWLHLLLSL
jgi:hypothetical protein